MDDLFWNPAVLVPLVLVGFSLWWCFILLVVAHVGGWARLAVVYRTWSPFEGRTWRAQPGRVGWASYHNCLTVGCNARGSIWRC